MGTVAAVAIWNITVVQGRGSKTHGGAVEPSLRFNQFYVHHHRPTPTTMNINNESHQNLPRYISFEI